MDINIDEDDLLIRFAGETGSGFDVQYVAGKKLFTMMGRFRICLLKTILLLYSLEMEFLEYIKLRQIISMLNL